MEIEGSFELIYIDFVKFYLGFCKFKSNLKNDIKLYFKNKPNKKSTN